MASEDSNDRLRDLEQQLARLQADNDRLRAELSARPAAPEPTDKVDLLQGTLFISEVEVRSAIARQLRNGARLLQASKCLYLLFDGQQELVAQRPALGVDEEQLSKFRMGNTRGISGEVFRTRKPIRLLSLESDERSGEEPLAEMGVQNGICVPLLVQIRDEENRVIDSRAIGVLWVMNRRGTSAFTEDDERLLTVFARQVAAVVSNAKFFDELMNRNKTLESTLEHLPAGIVFIGLDERIQLINEAARRLFGIADGRGVGEAYFRLIDHQETCEVLGASLREDEDKLKEVPFEVDSEERVFQIQAARVRGGEDALNGVVAIFDDVTEVHRLDRMKQDFVQTFSTELLGPLASIQGFSAMLDKTADEFGSHVRREVHGVIIGECQRLRRHIQDLLNVSRFEQGIRIHLNVTQFDLGLMVRRVVEHDAVLARRHSFALELPEGLPPVLADEARLEEVVFNLVDNAMRYSPDGGEVKVRVAPEEGGLRVEVEDEGVGIAAENHEQVFQKFARVQQADERVHAGRGIGLFISRFFVEAHGGKIGLHSEPEKGSTFWFTVPFQPVVSEDEEK